MRLWRLSWARFAEAAFSGQGSVDFGGRWNPEGIRMVYTSTTRALAAMEFFVHMIGSQPPNEMAIIHADIPDEKGMIERVSPENLPEDWRKSYAIGQRIGAEWIASGASLALEVPSVVVEGEWNVLLNPMHPDFVKVKIGKPEPFQYDQRMFGK